jgi:drug/metabolite transporter (DMT)-like permease
MVVPMASPGAAPTEQRARSYFVRMLTTGGGRLRGTTLLCLAILYSVWGSTYLAMRVAVTSFAPFRMGGIRFLVAGALLYLLLRLRGHRPPTWRQWRSCALIGSLMMGMGLGCTALAVRTVSSGVAAMVFGCVPLFSAAIQRAFGQRLVRREIVGVCVGFAGVALLTLRGSLAASPLAAALLITGAASYSLGCVLSGRLDQPLGAMSTAAQMIFAGAVLFAVSMLRGESFPAHPSLASVVALAHLIFLGSMLAYSALNHLLRTERPSLATSYAFVNPVVALALGAAIGHEHVGKAEIAAVSLVLVAVILVARAKSKSSILSQRAGLEDDAAWSTSFPSPRSTLP